MALTSADDPCVSEAATGVSGKFPSAKAVAGTTAVTEAMTPPRACLSLMPLLALDRLEATPPPGQRGYAKVSSGARTQRSRRPRTAGSRRPQAAECGKPCAAAWATAQPIKGWIKLIIDSGSTWHVHNNRDDLTNQRPCLDTISDAQGTLHSCDCIGDLTLLALWIVI